ncbi:MAG TPA: polysaccharide deacetylase family protein [Geminicoccaceae bacterium]|nr:polysaccharide deacetylase family protein [Geminicoccus sp.]HMU51634.1 polysaccharide deacetylase family protein [Geminicoccaceae bacterium]
MRLKSVAVRVLAKAARLPPLRRAMRALYRRRTAVVFYHGVWTSGAGQTARFGGLEIDALARDLRLLARYFRFVPLDEVLRLNNSGTMPGDPVMAVTFDDGHDMARSGAVDLLDEFRIPATLFVMPCCVGNRHLMWMHKFFAILEERGAERFVAAYNRVAGKVGLGPIGSAGQLPCAAKAWPMRLKDELAQAIYDGCDMPPVGDYLDRYRPYVTWEQLQAWRDRGHAVGLHTATHPFCSMLGRTELEEEVVVPAWQLRRRLSLPTLPFAYPFGDRIASPGTASAIAMRAGLSCMLGVDGLSRPRTSPMALERIDAEAGLDLHLFAKPVRSAVLDGVGRRLVSAFAGTVPKPSARYVLSR